MAFAIAGLMVVAVEGTMVGFANFVLAGVVVLAVVEDAAVELIMAVVLDVAVVVVVVAVAVVVVVVVIGVLAATAVSGVATGDAVTVEVVDAVVVGLIGGLAAVWFVVTTGVAVLL